MKSRRKKFIILAVRFTLTTLMLFLCVALWPGQGFAREDTSKVDSSEKFPGGSKETFYEDGIKTIVDDENKDKTIREVTFYYPNGKPEYLSTTKKNADGTTTVNITEFDKNSNITWRAKMEFAAGDNPKKGHCHPVSIDDENWKYDELGRPTQHVKTQLKEDEANGTIETTSYTDPKDKKGTTSKKNIHWDKEGKKWVDDFGIQVEGLPSPADTKKCTIPAESQPKERLEKSSNNQPSDNNIRRFEFFGGYAYLHAAGEEASNLNGWNLAFGANIHKPVSVVVDFSGGYGAASADLPGGGTVDTNLQRYLFLVGPQFNFPQVPRVTPFGQILFGAALDFNQTAGVDSSATAFAMAVGGGLDLRINSHVGWRLFQTDYVLTDFGGAVQNNFRFSTGVVVRFGRLGYFLTPDPSGSKELNHYNLDHGDPVNH